MWNESGIEAARPALRLLFRYVDVWRLRLRLGLCNSLNLGLDFCKVPPQLCDGSTASILIHDICSSSSSSSSSISRPTNSAQKWHFSRHSTTRSNSCTFKQRVYSQRAIEPMKAVHNTACALSTGTAAGNKQRYQTQHIHVALSRQVSLRNSNVRNLLAVCC